MNDFERDILKKQLQSSDTCIINKPVTAEYLQKQQKDICELAEKVLNCNDIDMSYKELSICLLYLSMMSTKGIIEDINRSNDKPILK